MIISECIRIKLRSLSLAAALLVAAPLAWATHPAQAAGPPSVRIIEGDTPGSGFDPSFLSTRASVTANLQVNELTTRWRAEYATSKAALESGAGTVVSSGEQPGDIGGGGDDITFGSEKVGQLVREESRPLARGFMPNTHYYARFIAENSAGAGEASFQFTTQPISRPEVGTAEQEISSEAHLLFRCGPLRPTVARCAAEIESNGADTGYRLEYSPEPNNPSAWRQFGGNPSGTVSAAEDSGEFESVATGLEPEATYYLRLVATNEAGTLGQTEFESGIHVRRQFLKMPSARPRIFPPPTVRNVTAQRAHVTFSVAANDLETDWEIELAPSPTGPWAPAPGAEGTIGQAQAEATNMTSLAVEAELEGLNPDSTYYVRVAAHNQAGDAQVCTYQSVTDETTCEPATSSTAALAVVETAGAPRAKAFAVHALEGESLRLLGTVNPNSALTEEEQLVTLEGEPTAGTFTLTFAGRTTSPLPPGASALDVEEALNQLENGFYDDGGRGGPQVRGPDGGPYRIYFSNHTTDQPQVEGDGSGLSPAGTVSATTLQQGGEGYDTNYAFQYVTEQGFTATGWAQARETGSVDLGPGNEAEYVGAKLPQLLPGESYRYRIAASNDSPGDPTVHSEEQTLVAPAPPSSTAPEECSNEVRRSGPSAALPDCRAYEQLTPTDKSGARDLFNYNSAARNGTLVGEDGDHAMVEADTVAWGSEPDSGQSPYFFSRQPNGTWRMTAGAVQPETGVERIVPEAFDPNLTLFAFHTYYVTSPGNESKTLEFRLGSPGGPYTTVASVPRKQVSSKGGWVAASADFSTVVLAVEDRRLLEYSTGTTSGEDLYEYSGGQLRQLNVDSSGKTIGTCGGTIAKGRESEDSNDPNRVSSRNALSSDGRRIFFEAVPSRTECSGPAHLYVRIDGTETIDLGQYKFVAAVPDGSEVLLEDASGELFVDRLPGAAPVDLTDGEERAAAEERFGVLPRYAYFRAYEFLGFQPDKRVEKTDPETGYNRDSKQAWRLDRQQNLVQCISCASAFDPEPRFLSTFGLVGGNGGQLLSRTGSPRHEVVSANGDFAFFDTPSALLPQDVDGEVAPQLGVTAENSSEEFSLSSDVYEWRAVGVDGCRHVQGCLALISNGQGGYLNLLLGSAHEGRDVYIYTSSRLGGRDTDGAGDIYDARIGGGEPPPLSRPIECEGDACHHPAAPSAEPTLSTSVPGGAGNPGRGHHRRKHRHRKHHHPNHHLLGGTR